MLIFFLSFLHSTNFYVDENQTKVTSIQFKESGKSFFQEDLTYIDTPIHMTGGKDEQIEIKKISAFKYILIDAITIKVNELTINDANQFPFKIINGGQILIQNSLFISSNSNENVYIPQAINIAKTNNLANGFYTVYSTSANSDSYNLYNATLSFEGNSFFTNSISGDSDSSINLTKASSLTSEIIEGNLTIICDGFGNSGKTNLYISKPSSFSHLIIMNDTDFFAQYCTIEKITVSPTDQNSQSISLDLSDSCLQIEQAILTNCQIFSTNSKFTSTSFNLKSYLFDNYQSIIDNPNIVINDISYQGNVTFDGKFILSLTGNVNQETGGNPLTILADEPSKIQASNGIFLLINSEKIEVNKFQFDLANLMILQCKESDLTLSDLNSFFFIDSSTEQKEFKINISNTKEALQPAMHVVLIGQAKTVDLILQSNSSNIDFFANFSNSEKLSITVNSLIEASIDMNIVNASAIEFTDLNNVNKMNYIMSSSTESVTFSTIGSTIENFNETFYLTYTLPLNSQISQKFEKIDNFTTVLIYDVNEFPTFSNNGDYSIEMKNCSVNQINKETAKLLKRVENSNIFVSDSDIQFNDTLFINCNITSESKIVFIGSNQNDQIASQINVLNCSEFSVENYRPLYIDSIETPQNECSIACVGSHLHLLSNENNLTCDISDNSSYLYISEENTSSYTIKGEGNFILKNAKVINDDILDIQEFSGSLFIYRSSEINISEDSINKLHNLLLLSSEFTIQSSISIDNIGFYNSTVYVNEASVDLHCLSLFNSVIRSTKETNEPSGTININEFLFNGKIVVNNLNLSINKSVNNMPNFYQQYKINKTMFFDSYAQEIQSLIRMIPFDKTSITFGNIQNENEEIVFGDNYEHSLFSFYGNSIMTKETLRFLNFDYFFSNIDFTNDKKIFGNIKSAEYPIISFEENETNITCPEDKKVIFVNQKENNGQHIFEVACSSNDNYNNDEYFDLINCSQSENNSLICSTENESQIVSTSTKVVVSSALFEEKDIFKCDFDSIIMTISNINNIVMDLDIHDNSKVTFYEKKESTVKNLMINNNSHFSIYRNILDNSSLTLTDHSSLTILDDFPEYYSKEEKKSETVGCLHHIIMNESSMKSDFMFNLSTSYFSSSSCSFTNAEIYIYKTKSDKKRLNSDESEVFCAFNDTLSLLNSNISIRDNVQTVHFSDFQYNGLNSRIIINGNAEFNGTVHVNGVINCPNSSTILDLTQADSTQHIILYDLQVNCTVNFSQPERIENVHLGGRNSIFNKNTIFIPNDLDVFVEGRLKLVDFNSIKSATYFSNYTDILNTSFINDHHGKPEIIFSDYNKHEVNFNITGEANITILDTNLTFMKSFQTFNNSMIYFVSSVIFKEGATFNGHHIIDDSLRKEKATNEHLMFTDQSFLFNEFSCEGRTTITIQSENITIKDSHNENEEYLLQSIQADFLKVQQMFGIESLFNKNQIPSDVVDIANTDFDWMNIKLVSTRYFRVNLFPHRVINFYYNDITLTNCKADLLGGYIRDVYSLSSKDTLFNTKADYIEAQSCTLMNPVFTNYITSIGCQRLQSSNPQFRGYVDLYHPEDIDMLNVTINFSLPNNYPIFNMHNSIFNDNKKYSLLLDEDNDASHLTIRIELNSNRQENFETAKLFMFEVMPNINPFITTTEMSGEHSENHFNSEITDNRIITFKNLICGNDGEYIESENKCKSCKNGFYSYEDKCYESPEGKFVNQSMTLDRDCPIGYYNDKRGQTSCTKCPNHMTTLLEGSTRKSACVCEVGYMYDESNSVDDNEKCVECPEGLACNKPNTLISNVKILEGYYYYNKDYDTNSDKNEFNITDYNLTHNLNSTYIFKCLTKSACISQIQSPIRLTQCQEEYDGFMCSKCKKKYFHKSIAICTKCSKFPIVALAFGTVIHAFLIFYCFFYDERFCVIFYLFMIFTQHYCNIYCINIDWPGIFTYVNIIFESINLDFRRFFDCETNDEVWNQGYVFLSINCVYISCFIFFVVMGTNIKKLKEDSSMIRNDALTDLNEKINNTSNSNQNNNNNNNSDKDNNKKISHKENIKKNSQKVLQILAFYYFMTFLTQFRWLLSVMCRKDGHLIVYPFIITSSSDYKVHSLIIFLNSIYFFGFFLLYISIFFFTYVRRPVTLMLSLFKYLLYNVRYSFLFLPFIFILKSMLMCFFVIYLNNQWFINVYLIIVLIACLSFFLYSQPFISRTIRYFELLNLLFEMFIAAIGIMAQQTNRGFNIFSYVLLSAFLVFYISVSVYLIYKYLIGYKERQEKFKEYNNMDDTYTIDKNEVMIKFSNRCNKFFFEDKKFSIEVIVRWFVDMDLINKGMVKALSSKFEDIIKDEDITNDYHEIESEVNDMFNKTSIRELFKSFYSSQDSDFKAFIYEFLKELYNAQDENEKNKSPKNDNNGNSSIMDNVDMDKEGNQDDPSSIPYSKLNSNGSNLSIDSN